MCKLRLLGIVLWLTVTSSIAQNPMKNGQIEEMVKLIKTNERLAQSYAEPAMKADKDNTDLIAKIGLAYFY